MSVNCYNFSDPRFWIVSESTIRELVGSVNTRAFLGTKSDGRTDYCRGRDDHL